MVQRRMSRIGQWKDIDWKLRDLDFYRWVIVVFELFQVCCRIIVFVVNYKMGELDQMKI